MSGKVPGAGHVSKGNGHRLPSCCALLPQVPQESGCLGSAWKGEHAEPWGREGCPPENPTLSPPWQAVGIDREDLVLSLELGGGRWAGAQAARSVGPAKLESGSGHRVTGQVRGSGKHRHGGGSVPDSPCRGWRGQERRAVVCAHWETPAQLGER